MSVLSLSINPASLSHNFSLLQQRCLGTTIAGVVKANAYGLGFSTVVPVLYRCGCRTFFVNRLEEGKIVRRMAPESEIFILDALIDAEDIYEYKNNRLTPVFSTIESLNRYPDEENIAVRLDIGFNLAGINAFNEASLKQAVKGRKVTLLMAHLSCAECPDSSYNQKELRLFSRYAALFPDARKSLSASFGLLLGKEYWFDIIRAGAFLYGSKAFPQSQYVAGLTTKVGWIRWFDAGDSLGYNHTCVLKKRTLVASLLTGSGDGIVHKQGCYVDYKGIHLPVLASPSTNYLPVDASRVADCIHVSDEVDLFNTTTYTPDDLASDAAMGVGADVLIRLNIF